MAPGALPRPGRVPEQRLLSPEIRRWRRRSYGTLSGNLIGWLGFSVPRLLIGEGASSEEGPGGLTHRRRGPGAGRAAPVCGPLALRLLLSFGCLGASGKNKASGTCFVQFREYFLCITSETQKQQKTGNWHCGTSLIG